MPIVSIAAALVVIAVGVVGFLRLRRHPAWPVSSDGRFFVSISYWMLAVGVYWLVTSPTRTDWEWALGNAWTFAAAVAYVRGREKLAAVPRRCGQVSRSLESLAPTETP